MAAEIDFLQLVQDEVGAARAALAPLLPPAEDAIPPSMEGGTPLRLLLAGLDGMVTPETFAGAAAKVYAALWSSAVILGATDGQPEAVDHQGFGALRRGTAFGDVAAQKFEAAGCDRALMARVRDRLAQASADLHAAAGLVTDAGGAFTGGDGEPSRPENVVDLSVARWHAAQRP